MNLAQAVKYGEEALSSIMNKDMEAEIKSNVYFLLSSLLKMTIPNIKFNASKDLSSAEEKTYLSWIDRRLKGEPVQYITGEADFWSMTFKITNGVLIPRQDTETLVSEVKSDFNDRISDKHNFLDICCGSGCIGISILSFMNAATVTFADISAKAIEFATINAKNMNVAARSKFIISDMFKNLKGNGPFDFITANPPYIKKSDLKGLPIEICLFEPIEALDGGEDGLQFYYILANEGKKFLKKGRTLYTEIGYNQADSVSKIFSDAGWKDIKIVKDLSKNPRVFKGTI